MSLQDRAPMKACGKPFASVEAAERYRPVIEGRREVVTGCPCGQVHTQAVATGKPRTLLKTRTRNTGPSRETRAMVMERDGYLCAGCGKAITSTDDYSVQHRNARGMGGTSRREANSLENLVLLCGSATSPGGCHLLCERRDKVMHERGLWLKPGELPALIPVAYATRIGVRVPMWLTEDGQRLHEPPEGVNAA